MNSDHSRIYFNERTLKNDLAGSIQGSLLFAQSSVIPSRASALPGDTQPRLVALRDTLAMLKPLNNFDLADGIEMVVKVEGRPVFSTQMALPEDLPNVAGYVGITEADLVDPGRYGYVIDTQVEIDRVAGDPDSIHLKARLKQYGTLQIKLADNKWAAEFHLPGYDASLHGKCLVFRSDAFWACHVRHGAQRIVLQDGQTLVFVNRNGWWGGLDDVAFSRISYGVGFWSAIIPWHAVRPQMSLSFYGRNTSGNSVVIELGAPTEVLLNTVDIGMLLPNREVLTAHFDTEHHRQYFQQIPCSRLVVNQYEPVHWREIMMPDGTLYKTHSSDTGDVYSGDLRQRIGKELVSLGINNASYGIHSSPGSGEDNLNKHFLAAEITAHSSIGKYANGDVIHGLSGGGSIVTLESHVDNEFSHELGHNFGVGHSPGAFNGSVHRPANAINSTCGWDSDRNAFLPNFAKIPSGKETCLKDQCQAPFHGRSFSTDPMEVGDALYPHFNGYPSHTPYVSQLIQRFLEEKVVFDPGSSTGYMKWDEAQRAMQEWAEFCPVRHTEFDLSSMAGLLIRHRFLEVSVYNGHWAADVYIPRAHLDNRGKAVYVVHEALFDSVLHINGSDIPLKAGTMLRYESNGSTWVQVEDFTFNVARKPFQQGVPVTTLLGYYDPEDVLPSYLYPALYCAHGSVFHADREVETLAARCYLRVLNDRGEKLDFRLRSKRGDVVLMNRFHVNVYTSFNATAAEIVIAGRTVGSIQLSPPKGTSRYSIQGRK